MFNPFSKLGSLQIALIVAGSCFLAGTGAGWTARGYVADSRELAARKQADSNKVDAAESVSAAASQHSANEAKLNKDKETVYVEVEKIIERPVYRNVCIDDDGLRQLERAIQLGEQGVARTAP